VLEALENSSENTSTHDTNVFQKFLCIVDRHEKTDVLLYQLFWLQPFCKLSFRCGGSKKGRVKKVVKQKVRFFMPLNYEKEFLKSLLFHNFFPELLTAATIPGVEIFN
jgi:hypothetical protein